MSRSARVTAFVLFIVALGPSLHVSGAQPSAPACHSGGRFLRTGAGATLGAFVGLVAWHVRYSDWTDAVNTPAGTRARNQAMIGGAVAGAVLGNLPFFRRGCAPTAASPALPRDDARRAITTAEIQRFGANGTVYDVVYARRRQWLNLRGLSLAETPSIEQDMKRGGRVTEAKEASLVVYLDNARLGDWEQLRALPLNGVTEIRYYDAAQASQRWGPGHEHGVIQVLTGTSAPVDR